MESRENRDFDLYKDIQGRTNGEIYIGVVGPVRTGKSTFIKRFMDLFVLPNMKDENAKRRAEDELPQSAAGKTIMTTEPKFIPQEAASITLADQSEIKVRLIDCVGFMVQGGQRTYGRRDQPYGQNALDGRGNSVCRCCQNRYRKGNS